MFNAIKDLWRFILFFLLILIFSNYRYSLECSFPTSNSSARSPSTSKISTPSSKVESPLLPPAPILPTSLQSNNNNQIPFTSNANAIESQLLQR